jgi:hypothetical protein
LEFLHVPRQKPLSSTSRAKNSLRPFFNSNREKTFRYRHEKSFWQQLQSVREETSINDYPAVCRIVEENRAYPFPGIGNTFPTDEEHIPNPYFAKLKPLKLSNELALQVARLNCHAAKLTAALESLANINDCLVARKFAEAELAIAEHKRFYTAMVAVFRRGQPKN